MRTERLLSSQVLRSNHSVLALVAVGAYTHRALPLAEGLAEGFAGGFAVE